ncbi:UreF-domain-containing protein [Xylariaceae sp. FL0804]|nr:UreF-domain-containing protein [Xylariaceae sp. FL0804]
MSDGPQAALLHEIADLEQQLARARRRLNAAWTSSSDGGAEKATAVPGPRELEPPPTWDPALHQLLLLADSALPLGSFAFSSGLESYLAHQQQHQHQQRQQKQLSAWSSSSSRSWSPAAAFASSFLPLSLSSYAGTSLPFVLAAHADPSPAALALLDDALDAAVVCAVGRRASVAQGRALLALWEKSLCHSSSSSSSSSSLRPFVELLRQSTIDDADTTTNEDKNEDDEDDDEDDPPLPPPVSAHLAPLFGAVARLLGLSRAQAAHAFLLGHARALVGAAVRAGVFGPYQAQRVLAGPALQGWIAGLVRRDWLPLQTVEAEAVATVAAVAAAQRVPAMDLWIGRHELLYSRIFNS